MSAAAEQYEGQLVTVEFVRSDDPPLDCGLEDCECPMHEWPTPQPGTYVTFCLDDDHAFALGGRWRLVRFAGSEVRDGRVVRA